MICLILGLLVNMAGFLFSTGIDYFFSSFVRTSDILEIQARFLILGVLIFISFLGSWVESSLMGSREAMLWSFLGAWVLPSG